MRIRHQDRLVNPADDTGRIFQVQQLDAEAVGAHRANPVGDHQPALRCFDGRAAVSHLYEFVRELRLLQNLGLLPEV